MLWIRVQMPHRPGSLGRLATELGRAGVDIISIEVVDRDQDIVVNDLMVELPSASHTPSPDLRVLCHAVPGCVVETIRPYARGGGVERDLAALERMASRPAEAVNTLLNAAPLIFRSHWAAVIHTSTASIRTWTSGVPEQSFFTHLMASTDDLRHTLPRAVGDHRSIAVMLEPLTPDDSFVVGRRDGPAYFDSEILRLRYLISAATSPWTAATARPGDGGGPLLPQPDRLVLRA